jgi:hypothetical protein
MRMDKGWSRKFDAVIVIDDGQLRTLRDAGHHVAALPSKMQQQPHWQLAAQLLLSAAESGGIVMMAETAMRRVLGHGPPEPHRKRAKVYRVVK